MVCIGLPAPKSGSRCRDGFDLAPKLCFDNLLKIIMIIIANIFLIAIIKFIIYIPVIIFSISESKL